MHPEHRFFQKITPLGPFLFILHVASGNGQDPAPSFPWHLAPAELGVMPLPIVMGGHDGQAMRLRRLRKDRFFALNPTAECVALLKACTPCKIWLQIIGLKLSFLVRPKKMHGGICRGVLKVGPGEAQKDLNGVF